MRNKLDTPLYSKRMRNLFLFSHSQLSPASFHHPCRDRETASTFIKATTTTTTKGDDDSSNSEDIDRWMRTGNISCPEEQVIIGKSQSLAKIIALDDGEDDGYYDEEAGRAQG
jgi:hypothetical protein